MPCLNPQAYNRNMKSPGKEKVQDSRLVKCMVQLGTLLNKQATTPKQRVTTPKQRVTTPKTRKKKGLTSLQDSRFESSIEFFEGMNRLKS